MGERKAQTFQGNPCKRGHIGIRRVIGGDCVDCVNQRNRERWEKKPGHKEKWLAHRRKLYATPEGRKYRRNKNLGALYGISLEDYERMEIDQGFGCAICGELPGGMTGKFHVDHDHETGAVRSLLCMKCNVGLGSFDENPARLRLAIAYLAHHGKGE